MDIYNTPHHIHPRLSDMSGPSSSSHKAPFSTLTQLYNQYRTRTQSVGHNVPSSSSSSLSSLDIKLPGSPRKHRRPPVQSQSPTKPSGMCLLKRELF